MDIDEIWKPLVYRDVRKGMYEISNTGKIRRADNGRLMILNHGKVGYMYVRLALETSGKSRLFTVHRIVAWHFVDGHTDENNVVNHIDGDKTNNNYTNLEWCTQKHNAQHAFDTGIREIKYGDETNRHFVTNEIVERICQMLIEFDGSAKPILDILLSEGIYCTFGIIESIKTKDTWSHVSDKYFTKDYFKLKRIDEVKQICAELVKSSGDVKYVIDKLGSTINWLSYDKVQDIKNKGSYADISDEYFKHDQFKKPKLFTEHEIRLICEELVRLKGDADMVYDNLKDSIENINRDRVNDIKHKGSYVKISDEYFDRGEFNKEPVISTETLDLIRTLLLCTVFHGSPTLVYEGLNHDKYPNLTKNVIGFISARCDKPKFNCYNRSNIYDLNKYYDMKTKGLFEPVSKSLLDCLTRSYSSGNPDVTDDAYDALVEEYVNEHGEDARPFMRVKKPDGTNDLPNQTLSKVYGVKESMRPGQKTYMDWICTMKNVNNDQMIAVQAKFDGVSVTWDCKENKWFTRGDYDNGESMDITYLFGGRYIRMCKMLAPEYRDPIAIKFEAIMATDIFEALGLNQKYVNPRAAVSAIIMSRDKKYAGYIELIQLRYYYEDGRVLIPDYDLDAGHGCCAYKFMPYDDYEGIEHFIGEMLDMGAKVELTTDEEGNVHTFEIDGVVVSFFSQADGGDAELIQPLTEIAIKILNNVKETKIKAIEWQMGKTGKITPVGILEPVTFDNGVTVDHVGLSTFERVYDLNLHFDETVRVMHNIVPYLLDGKGDGGMRIPTPTKCPACGHPLDMRNLKTVRCTNPECQSKKLGDIIRYCETMKMMGVSKGILTKLYELGYVKSIPDLYKIDGNALALEKGFAETSVNALLSSIQGASTRVPVERWFGALPCLNVSQKTWKTIFDTRLKQDEGFVNVLVNEINMGNCESFLQALIQPIPGIGPATWASIAEGFRNNWKDIRDTIGHIQLLVDLTKSEDSKGLVCLSGTRDETVKCALEKAGYDVTDSWSSKVDILIIPDRDYRSSKVARALKNHIPIFTVEDALVNIINMDSIL